MSSFILKPEHGIIALVFLALAFIAFKTYLILCTKKDEKQKSLMSKQEGLQSDSKKEETNKIKTYDDEYDDEYIDDYDDIGPIDDFSDGDRY